MKKTLACLLVVASTLQMAYDQGGERAVMKGQNSINVYYGLNLLRGFYKNVASSSGSDVKIGGFGPVGLVFEHMVTDGIGLGAEVALREEPQHALEVGHRDALVDPEALHLMEHRIVRAIGFIGAINSA